MTNVYTVYSDVLHNIASDFPARTVQHRLQSVTYKLVDPKVMANHLYGDNYRGTMRVPANDEIVNNFERRSMVRFNLR